jgi:putative transposase
VNSAKYHHDMNFIEGHFYHVYNRGNNSQDIFFEEANYHFLLNKIKEHFGSLVRILAYCLMPNHFHLLIYIPDSDSPGDLKSPGESSKLGISKSVTDAIAVILRSYTRAINKRYFRTGSLFQQSTKAIDLNNGPELYPLICFNYIHQNPLKAKLVDKMEDWEFSSYNEYIGQGNKGLCDLESSLKYLDIPLNKTEFIEQSKAVISYNEYIF